MKLNKTSENPFYGKEAMLDLYHSMDGKKSFNRTLLQKAWNECKDSPELKKGFWSLVFALGDITDRQHNIFGKKMEGGGYAKREEFFECLKWMRQEHPKQYKQFMLLIVEYTGWDSLLANRVRTRKKTDRVESVYSAVDGADLDELAAFIAWYIRTTNNSYKLNLLAKRLVRVDNRSPKSDEAKHLRRVMASLYDKLSELMGWEITRKENYFSHTGLYEWRQKYIVGLESYLFSTQEVQDMGREEFLQWLDNTPSTARFRIKKRLDKNEKWIALKEWYEQWESFKEKKQAEARVLKEKIRQGTATEEDKIKLATVSKEAKVTTGARNLKDEIEKLLNGTTDATDFNLLADSLLEKMELRIKILLTVDCSGSMGGNYGLDPSPVKPYDVASLLATIAGLKNPSDITDTALIRFGTHADLIRYGSTAKIARNRFLEGAETETRYLINREDDFLSNYNRMRDILRPTMGGTHISTVSGLLRKWADTPEKKEELQTYPLILVISDGEFNNRPGTAASVAEFMSIMRQIGWNGVLCIWDIQSHEVRRADYSHVPNVVHLVGWSASNINQIFSNLHDLDVVDVYTPLEMIARSERYSLVRKEVI